MNASALADLLKLRRLRERRASLATAKAREAATRAIETKEVMEQACSAFAAECRGRERAVYADMAGRLLTVRAVQAAAARIAEDIAQADALAAQRNQAGAALAEAEAGLCEAEQSYLAKQRDLERFTGLIERLEADAHLREEVKDEVTLEELIFPDRRG